MTVSQGWWPRLIDLFIVCNLILFCGLVVYYCSMLKHLHPETGECIVFGTATSGECFCVWLLWLFVWAWFRWNLPLSLCYVEIQKKKNYLKNTFTKTKSGAINGLKCTVFQFLLAEIQRPQYRGPTRKSTMTPHCEFRTSPFSSGRLNPTIR